MISLNKTIFRRFFIALLVCSLTVAGAIGGRKAILSAGGDGKPTVIIDAGHGLPDGGAVSSDGKVVESTVNLRIAELINSKLTSAGFNCVMTRRGEQAVYTEGKTIHEKKVSDTRNRVETAKRYPHAFLLSVHLNTYPSADVHGIQFFYNNGAEDIAREIQNAVNIRFQPDNEKTVKQIPSNVYLFKHIPNDCVLAECGFLTNSEDLAKLRDEEYLDQLASTVSEAIAYKLIGSEKDAG